MGDWGQLTLSNGGYNSIYNWWLTAHLVETNSQSLLKVIL